MLKLSAVIKSKPFQLTEVDGTDIDLEVTEFTVGDVTRLINIQRPIVEDKDLSIVEQSEMIQLSRLVCSVKLAGTDTPYWGSIQDFKSRRYPVSLLNVIYPFVMEFNPIKIDVEEKKS